MSQTTGIMLKPRLLEPAAELDEMHGPGNQVVGSFACCIIFLEFRGVLIQNMRRRTRVLLQRLLHGRG